MHTHHHTQADGNCAVESTTELTPNQLHSLAVRFRVLDPNLGHVDTFDDMAKAGLLYNYGLFRATPLHHRRKRRQYANAIAGALERKAVELRAIRSVI